MRLVPVLLVGVAVGGAFFLGRMSHPTSAAAAGSHKVLTAARGDVIRIPGIRTRCVVSEEAGRTNMLCNHTPHGRYELVLFRDRLFVYRNGNPDKPRFAARWNP